MTIWRMAMRCGDNGSFLHEECFALGVAAITYDGIAETDFSTLIEKDAKPLWRDLAPSQISSLRSLAYEMRGGDTIFVKAGRLIVGKGVVRGKLGERAYSFNHAHKRIIDENGTAWFQQVPVAWRPDFIPLEVQIGSNQRFAIQEVSLEDARRVERNLDDELSKVPPVSPESDALRTESYVRAGAAAMRIIERRHNALSNQFAEWLLAKYGIKAAQERGQIDIQFRRGNVEVLAELKICYGSSSRHAVREALGQLLEYNYYPSRKPTQEWLIVLDVEPEESDLVFISLLRKQLSLPICLGWQCENDFSFSPAWPA